MKYLITTIVAVLLVGCGETQESASTPEPEPAKSVNSKANKALLNAVNKGEIEAAKQAIADGANVGGALFGAAQNGHKEIAELLIAGGADVNASNIDGWTALHFAVSRKRKEVAELLISKGADVNFKNPLVLPPLTIAVIEPKQIDLVELLIKNGADVNALNEYGDTALGVARNEYADLLRNHGAKTAKELKAAGDNAEAFTALEKAIELANREEEGIDDDLIGVDEDGDGFDAYDEKLTGHSDTDPDDKPTQEEVDAALAALEDK